MVYFQRSNYLVWYLRSAAANSMSRTAEHDVVGVICPLERVWLARSFDCALSGTRYLASSSIDGSAIFLDGPTRRGDGGGSRLRSNNLSATNSERNSAGAWWSDGQSCRDVHRQGLDSWSVNKNSYRVARS
ncbi:hypothetical protein Tco_0018844 [Tanacetum coccineum]